MLNEEQLKTIETEQFKQWFGDSKVLDSEGLPLEVIHGSTNEFNEFDLNYAEKRGHVGGYFYFSNDSDDTHANYVGGGGDYEGRIAKLAEDLQNGGYDNRFGEISEEELESIEEDFDVALDKARELTSDGLETEYYCYLRMENPFYLDDNHYFSFELDMDYYRSEAEENIDKDDYDDDDEYEDAVVEEMYALIDDTEFDERVYIDEKTSKLINSMITTGMQFDGCDAVGFLYDLKDEYEDSLFTTENLRQFVMENEHTAYISDKENGSMIPQHFFGTMVKNMGYDGIIMDAYAANKRWNMEGISKDTRHYIVFEPNQIKSTYDNNKFSLESNNIYLSKQAINTSAEELLTSNQQVINVLYQKFGKKATNALIETGKLEIKHYNELPLRHKLVANNAEGIYEDGKVTLVSNKLTKNTIIPVFLHEMGAHNGFQGLMHRDEYKNVLNSFNYLVKSGDPIAVAAKKRAEESALFPNQAQDEYIPYLITLASEKEQNSPKIARLFDKTIASARYFLKEKVGVSLHITSNDIYHLSKKMIDKQIDLSKKEIYINGDRYQSNQSDINKNLLKTIMTNPNSTVNIFLNNTAFGQKISEYVEKKIGNKEINTLLPPDTDKNWKATEKRLSLSEFMSTIKESKQESVDRKQKILEVSHNLREKLKNEEFSKNIQEYLKNQQNNSNERKVASPRIT